MFKDGVSIHDELKGVELSKLRDVCDQQSRTKWTSIASRARLYQFIGLSDEQTQQEMRLKARSLLPLNAPAGSVMAHVNTSLYNEPAGSSRMLTSSSRGTKRYFKPLKGKVD
jgi:hypothetical protein